MGHKTQQTPRYKPITLSCLLSNYAVPLNLTNNITVIRCNQSRYQECVPPPGTFTRAQSMLFVLGNFSPLGKLSNQSLGIQGPSCCPLAAPRSPHSLNPCIHSSWNSSSMLQNQLSCQFHFSFKLHFPHAG